MHVMRGGRDLSSIGDPDDPISMPVDISLTKDGAEFSASSGVLSSSITVRSAVRLPRCGQRAVHVWGGRPFYQLARASSASGAFPGNKAALPAPPAASMPPCIGGPEGAGAERFYHILSSECCFRRQSISPDNLEDSTVIDVHKPFAMTFSLRYITAFLKAAPLSPVVRACPNSGSAADTPKH